MVLSSSAQASRNHAVHIRTTSTGWLRLLSTTEARTVSVQCLDVLLLETVNAYQSQPSPGQMLLPLNPPSLLVEEAPTSSLAPSNPLFHVLSDAMLVRSGLARAPTGRRVPSR